MIIDHIQSDGFFGEEAETGQDVMLQLLPIDLC